MTAEREHINVLFLDVDVYVADSLNCVCVEDYAFFLAQCTNFGNGLDCADFVVCVHYCNESGIGTDSVCNVLDLYYTV